MTTPAPIRRAPQARNTTQPSAADPAATLLATSLAALLKPIIGPLVHEAVLDAFTDARPAEPAPRLVDLSTAAARLGSCTPTVRGWIRRGMPVIRIGGCVRVELDGPHGAMAWLRAQSTSRPQEFGQHDVEHSEVLEP